MKRYTKTGEWVEEFPEGIRVGLTKDAVDDLGDVTFVELPSVGRSLASDEVAGVLEAVKAACDLHSPLAGTVKAVNTRLATDPGLLNRDPESQGWLFCLELSGVDSLERLLTPEQWSHWGERD